MNTKLHWESVYTSKASTVVSWYQPHATKSLRLIADTGLGKQAAIIDVGGGASTLVDDLLTDGYSNLTVLDLSAAALAAARQRLGHRAKSVQWLEADVAGVELPRHSVDLWHDRAVFHFLTDESLRRRYVEAALRAVKPGGHVIVATFAEDGPAHCSGLPVVRYTADELHTEFGHSFQLLSHDKEAHHTPNGATQQFVYCYCRKVLF